MSGLLIALCASILTGSVTILSIFINNKHFEKRLEIQYKNDLDLKKLERQQALRKEIYLDLVVSLSQSTTAIFSLLDLSNSREMSSRQFVEAASSLSKAQLVADIDTLRSITDLHDKLTACFTSALSARLLIESINIRKLSTEYSLKKASDSSDRIGLMIENLEIGSSNYEQQFQKLNNLLHFWGEEVQKFGDLLSPILRELIETTNICSTTALEDVPELRKKQAQVIVDIRKDLGETSDIEGISKIFEDSMRRNKITVETILSTVESISEQQLSTE